MRRVQATLLLIAALGLMLGFTASASAANCTGKVKASARDTDDRGDVVVYSYLVEPSMTGNAYCGKVSYEIELVERSANGKEETKRIGGTIKIPRGEAKARKVSHRVPKGTTVVRWSATATDCTVCGQ
jgi:hypothetical protein